MADRSLQIRGPFLAAARELVLRVGYHGTSLRDIAKRAEVPPGNVFYHFPTKESVLSALIEQEFLALDGWLRDLERPTSGASLKAFFEATMAQARDLVEHGCPLTILHDEAIRVGPTLRDAARSLLRRKEDWLRSRLEGMEITPAVEQAATMMIGLQGAIQMARIHGDVAILEREIVRWRNSTLLAGKVASR